jgi:hypothetical protein
LGGSALSSFLFLLNPDEPAVFLFLDFDGTASLSVTLLLGSVAGVYLVLMMYKSR